MLRFLLILLTKAWQRGGYVCATDEHYATITVADTVAYALLHISEYKDVFVSTLNRGLRRMLSLCEELTSDPYLLLIDEPISGLTNR